MAKLEPVAIQIIGLEDMRRLSAALEQYNAGSRGDAATWAAELAKAQDRIHQLEQVHDQQVGALTAARNNVDAFQRDLARTQADTSQAIQMLQGKRSATLTTNEVGAIADLVDRDVRREIGADHAETKQQLFIANEEITKQAREIDSLRAALRKEQKIKSFVNDECQKTRAALGLGRMAQAPEVLAAIDALQVDASMKQHTIDGLRGRAHDLEQTIAKQADVIKHMHEEYHQLQALKQGADYDLERAKEEIAFAEAEAAKYKPLIEAVRETGSRGGALFIAAGHWVELNGWTTTATDGKQYTRVELSGNYLLGGLKCL